MLLENASKHNVISQKYPLSIDIYLEKNKVVVENTLRPMQQHVPSSGKGLDNIRARYELLTDEQVEVLEEDKKFVVKLPLLHFDVGEKRQTRPNNLRIPRDI